MAACRALAEPFRRLVVDGRIPRSPPASAAKMARPTIKPVWPGWPGLHYPASTFALWMKKYKCEMSATKQHSKDLSDPKILVSYNKWNRNKVCFSLSLVERQSCDQFKTHLPHRLYVHDSLRQWAWWERRTSSSKPEPPKGKLSHLTHWLHMQASFLTGLNTRWASIQKILQIC